VPYHAHSEYLELLLDLGVVGLLHRAFPDTASVSVCSSFASSAVCWSRR
jgi:hypothetical protein